jgi:adenine-specific DNA methylase
MTQRRLIEEAFPLKKVSKDSRHEKNVRHGHISTLHIWPARRPLAACRAAIIAALMPDPGDEQGRAELCHKIESITHWGTENGPALDYFRREIRAAFGGRAPRVLDPFAGGGAIPLEAMRLGCEVIANDYNPVAWFILKCTLEFPQRLAGKTWPLPMTNEQMTNDKNQVAQLDLSLAHLSFAHSREGNLAAHVRYWGQWVLERARTELAPYYPAVNGQPTVAYLWARTVPCPDPRCGAEVPLLKTLWLCKKENKRRALRILPPSPSQGEGPGVRVRFEIWTPDPRDEVPPGTMAGAKSRCPVCGTPLTPNYIKQCGQAGKLGARMTAVVVETGHGREYRLPTPEEEVAAHILSSVLEQAAAQIPYGLPTEPLPGKERHRAVGSQLPDYGFKTWADIFTTRQLLALVTFVKWIRLACDEMHQAAYPEHLVEAVEGYLALALDRLVDQATTLCLPDPSPTQSGIIHTFTRFALPMTWDFIEGVTTHSSSGGFARALEWVSKVVAFLDSSADNPQPRVLQVSATVLPSLPVDIIVTDPPYYDAIPYSDLSDFFYVWLRRTVGDRYPEVFATPLTPKSDELVQQSKSGEPGRKGRADYETGIGTAFRRAWETLASDGRMVVVFAHKAPEAWETLVTAMIREGFTVTASWPIDTERETRARAVGSAALASSIWMVCRKRETRFLGQPTVGRYGAVRRAMEERTTERLRYFWDLGLSGPDFVWTAVGPALESYSAYDEVRRLDGSPFTVSEFLREVRRLVSDFALGQIVKSHSTEGLDEWTRYYLIHRNHFGLEAAPVGECILLSQGYGLDLNDLRGRRGFLVKAVGSDLRLAKWDERTRSDLGNPRPDRSLPLVDMLHRLIWLWAAGEIAKLRTYVEDHGLAQNDLFWAVAQAVLEMAAPKSKERALLEALVAWGRGKSPDAPAQPELGGLG